MQNYFDDDGTITFFGLTFQQFYPHIEIRILPLLIVSLFLIPLVKRVCNIEGNFYFSELLINSMLFVDAFTHVNGYYSTRFEIILEEGIWFDKVMHFVSGVVLIWALTPLLYRFILYKGLSKRPRSWAYAILIGFISIFYILWEIAELFIDRSVSYKYNARLITGMHDTNFDLTFNYAGIVLGVLSMQMYYYVMQIKQHLPVTGKIDRNVTKDSKKSDKLYATTPPQK